MTLGQGGQCALPALDLSGPRARAAFTVATVWRLGTSVNQTPGEESV